MAIVLFTTTDCHGGRQSEFARLITSLERQAAHGAAIRWYVLLQNCEPHESSVLAEQLPSFCKVKTQAFRTSLSAARNTLLEFGQHDRHILPDDIVAFPDDDCWYPDRFLIDLGPIFKERPRLDVVICDSSPEPDLTPFDVRSLTPASTRQIVRKTSSNSMFFRGNLIGGIGSFEERVGVGTLRPGGEDIDYAIRAFLLAREAGIIKRKLVGHPDWGNHSIAKYYHGNLFVLARHAHKSPALMWEFARKLLVGGYLSLTGDTRWSALGSIAYDALTAGRGPGATVQRVKQGQVPS